MTRVYKTVLLLPTTRTWYSQYIDKQKQGGNYIVVVIPALAIIMLGNGGLMSRLGRSPA